MKSVLYVSLGLAVVLGAPPQAQSPNAQSAVSNQSAATFVGTWHLALLDMPAANGSMTRVTTSKGLLIYMADGRMAVQVMPAEAQGGYEAVFGRYDVNPATQSLTHHVEGANDRARVGQDIRLQYRLEGRQLIVRSADPTQKWSATWERD